MEIVFCNNILGIPIFKYGMKSGICLKRYAMAHVPLYVTILHIYVHRDANMWCPLSDSLGIAMEDHPIEAHTPEGATRLDVACLQFYGLT